MTDLTLPLVHLNGTGRDTLTKEYYAAYRSLKTSIEHFLDITCNARDYYPISDSAYTKARDHRDANFAKLKEVLDYLEAHIEHLNA